MIVCHCNVLSGTAIRRAVEALLDDDPHRVIVPGMTLRSVGCRGKCCNCFPQLARLIVETVEDRRAQHATAERRQTAEVDHEGREIRHRAA